MTGANADGAGGRARKRRQAREGALNKSAQEKRALYHCNYCQKDISNTPRIKCAECADFDLCLECFSVGVEIAPHKNNHDYRVVDNLSFPILDPEWGTDEEILLLEAIEQCGLGSWQAVADHMGPTKTAAQCKAHYFSVYIDVPSFPSPSPTPAMQLYEQQKAEGILPEATTTLPSTMPAVPGRKGRRNLNSVTSQRQLTGPEAILSDNMDQQQHTPPQQQQPQLSQQQQQGQLQLQQQQPLLQLASTPDLVLYPPGVQHADTTELLANPSVSQQDIALAEEQAHANGASVLFPPVQHDVPTPARVGGGQSAAANGQQGHAQAQDNLALLDIPVLNLDQAGLGLTPPAPDSGVAGTPAATAGHDGPTRSTTSVQSIVGKQHQAMAPTAESMRLPEVKEEVQQGLQDMHGVQQPSATVEPVTAAAQQEGLVSLPPLSTQPDTAPTPVSETVHKSDQLGLESQGLGVTAAPWEQPAGTLHSSGEQHAAEQAEKRLHRNLTADEPSNGRDSGAVHGHTPLLVGTRTLHHEHPLATTPGGQLTVDVAAATQGPATSEVLQGGPVAVTPTGLHSNGVTTEPPKPTATGQGDYAMGYHAKRNEFEPEYDNDAECIIADMEFTDQDTEEDRQMKLRILEIYNKRLDERASRKQFLKDYGLLSMRKLQALERRRSSAERDTHARMRVFARYSAPQAHDDLVEGLLIEQRLRARIQELKEYRRLGVRTLEEAEIHDSEARKNKKPNTGTGPLFGHHDGGLSLTPLLPAGALSPAQQAAVAAAAKDSGAATSATAPPPGGNKNAASSLHIWRTNRGVQLDITCLPGTEVLTSRERDLCQSLRLLPALYLAMKDTMLRDCQQNGPISRSEARTYFKLDSSKCLKLYDLWVSCGWVTSDKPGASSGQAAKQTSALDTPMPFLQ